MSQRTERSIALAEDLLSRHRVRVATVGDEVQMPGCAFCNEPIEFTDEDPIGIGVVEQWRPTTK